jgi:hypothetical protein
MVNTAPTLNWRVKAMNKEKIKKLINYNVTDCPVYINNSIFTDLLKCGEMNSIRQKAYAYGFYCLITYLYRNAKYQHYLLKQPDVKEILGYSPENRDLDYISKKHGLLDEMGYTETITDFPVRINTGKMIFLDMYRDTKNKGSLGKEVPSNYKVKKPVKAFYKDEKSKEAELLNGSFYNANDCHIFDIESFLECVSNEAIGCVGYFITSYIKTFNISLRTGSFSTTVNVRDALGPSVKTFSKYIIELAQVGLLDVDFRHNQEVKEVSIYLRQHLNTWRDECLAKYDGKCFISCSETNLDVHHVNEPFALIRDRIFDQSGIKYKPFNEYNKEELDFLSYRMVQEHKELEGIPLRADLHKLLHKLYGNAPSLENIIELKKIHLKGEV